MIIAVNMDFWAPGYNRQVSIGMMDYVAEHEEVRLYPGRTGTLVLPEPAPSVDGVIGAIPERGGDSETLPTVCIYTSVKSTCPAVGPDNRAVARLAFEHFRSRGLRQPAVLDLEKFHEIRSEPFVEICHERGFIPHRIPAPFFGESPPYRIPAEHRDHLARRLRLLPKPAGLFLPLDAVYPPILEFCRELNIRVPEDLALLGVNNDSEYCLHSDPTLSSIDLGAERIGHAAMANLVAMINGESVPDETLIPPKEVIARESSNFIIDEHPTVTKVLDYIHVNLSEPLETEDLLALQSLHRRAFESHFRQACGTSPKQYLIGLRLERARHLLETTDLTVAEIGDRCGIPNVSYLCQLFCRKHGRTPQAYREGFRGRGDGGQ